MSFDPHSPDAMFATISGTLKAHGKLLNEIHSEVKKTNGRVTALETDKKITSAQRKLVFAVAGVIGGAVGFAINLALTYFSTFK